MSAGLPRLSVLVVVYDMPRQAMNSLYSLSAHYQDGVAAGDYEVVVVENDSGNNLDAAAVAALGSNFRYYLRDEAGVSPVPAVAFGVSQCRCEMLGLIIDGARMLTPRTLQWVLLAGAMHDLPVVSVPGYHLGDQDQKSQTDRPSHCGMHEKGTNPSR